MTVFERFLYREQLSTIKKVYPKVLSVSNWEAMACLFKALHRPLFYGLEGSRGLLSLTEWSIVNASSGEHTLLTCHGLIGQIWVLVPMDCRSGTGEVGSFYLEMDPVPQKWLAIPFPGSVYFGRIHMDQHHSLQ